MLTPSRIFFFIKSSLQVVAHVELLEAVKLHMARLLHRSAGSTTDHLVLVTAMMVRGLGLAMILHFTPEL